ncbi:hypothetical protein A3D14_01185 [Candidatus Saccharibacteria bacterium RIFCSPHIGHO2_02_FULL_47_12]|nr:MAG: hypothetical protein A3D14_01185 [Candidatus Saccharibacteria bacterium RIFCSPHIGHO2_02_FULL_47_12]
MGRYIPPSELAINQRHKHKVKPKSSFEEILAIQESLPELVHQLFEKRPDLVTMVDFAHASARIDQRIRSALGHLAHRALTSAMKETLIYVPQHTGYYAHEFSLPAIPLYGVETYYVEGSSFSGYGVSHEEGYWGTHAVLLTEDGTVFTPGKKRESFFIEDEGRNCHIAVGYTGLTQVTSYPDAVSLNIQIQQQLNAQNS